MSASSFAAVSAAVRRLLLALIVLLIALPASAHVPRRSVLDVIDVIDAPRELAAAPPIDGVAVNFEPIYLYDGPTSFSVFISAEKRASGLCCALGGEVALQNLMHARYYDPNKGRFLSVDPARDSVDPAVPQTWNRYSYAWNNPLRFIDPTGKNATVACDENNQCTASVAVQVVADPNDPAQVAAANAYKQATESYWNGRTEAGLNNESITFNFAVSIVAPGQQQANMDTVTVVNGSGRSNIQMTLGPGNPSDTGTLYTVDTTGNPSGMAGIGPHESGHLLGLRDLYYPGEVVGLNTATTVDIMRYAQPTNNAASAFMMLSPANTNKTLYRVPPSCRHQPCR